MSRWALKPHGLRNSTASAELEALASSTIVLCNPEKIPRWIGQRCKGTEAPLRKEVIDAFQENNAVSGALSLEPHSSLAEVPATRPVIPSYLLVRAPVPRSSYKVRRLQHFFTLLSFLDFLLILSVYLRYDIGWERRAPLVEGNALLGIFVGILFVNILCNVVVWMCLIRLMSGCAALLAAQFVTILIFSNNALYVFRMIFVFVLWLVKGKLKETLCYSMVSPD